MFYDFNSSGVCDNKIHVFCPLNQKNECIFLMHTVSRTEVYVVFTLLAFFISEDFFVFYTIHQLIDEIIRLSKALIAALHSILTNAI